ncbi:hypothetical protein WL1483_697 [Aeromonas schubertii]|uniref:Uncharacterized protein n=1 Tax=Aeromonas schubertii TaxID=652 RepID=A0A0S2SEK9_9GAMM|nr:hypothetical protein WL1483_697 [Aeromonas schubertii]
MLGRLVGIGIGADADHPGPVGGASKLGAQQLGGVAFGEDPRLEVEARGELQVGVAGAGIAVDAAVLAPLIRIDGGIEGHIGRAVVADDAACLNLAYPGRRGRACRFLPPAVIDGLDALLGKAMHHVATGATSGHGITYAV